MEKQLIHPLQIGSVRLDNNLALAPMAGTTDVVFRRICRRLGAGLTVTELVSARGICHDPDFRRNWRYLAIDPQELPVAIQLFGSDPDDFSRAIAMILAHPVLSQCSLFDLNMGCPVNKVVKGGEGSALMRTPDLAARIVKNSVQAAAAAGKPVTVKFRKGWDDNSVNAVDFAKCCEQAGAAALTIHGRTRQQLYGGQADWRIIGEVKAAVRIPVFGNGDVTTPEAASRLFLETGADGLMIGRAALGNPWIFQSILAALGPKGLNPDIPEWLSPKLRLSNFTTAPMPPPADRLPVILEHLDGLIAMHGEATAVREMRKQLVHYLKGTAHGSFLKNQVMNASTRREIQALLEEWCIYCNKYC